MLDLAPEYKIIEKIYSDTDFSFYNARRDADNRSVLIKVLNENAPQNKLTQLKNEKNVLKRVLNQSTLECYGLECIQNRWMMVLEGFKSSELLSELLAKNKLDFKQKLLVGIAISKGLGEIHHHHVIHKDIKPSNILVNLDNNQVKFLNFNLSSLLSREIQHITNPKHIEGTLAYMSPEQTGRINSPVNYQTDIYSLGVTLYQMFTGRLPFEESDPMELVYGQIARFPALPSSLDKTIPEGLSAVIMKCLSKESQERYHSAFGLKNDLEDCLQHFDRNESNFTLRPGSKDIYDHFMISQKLYGREIELKRLQQMFDEVCQGENKICIVKGYAGIGKSRLVQALQKSVFGNKGYFITGKFDQFKKQEPFYGLLQALQNLVNNLLSENDTELAIWRQLINESLKSNAQLLTEYVPELKHIIGDHPLSNLTNPLEQGDRLLTSLKQFFQVFTNRKMPLVIALDDLQWADFHTFKFLESLQTKDFQNCMIIGTYRDNEVDENHPLTKSIKRIQDQNHSIEFVTVSPLDQEAVSELIADTLNSPIAHVMDLARFVLKKTQGNPFFINQYLNMIYHQGHLDFDTKTQSWVANMNEIEKTHVTENVVEMMTDKIRSLSDISQKTLKTAAAIGFSFNPVTLSQVLGCSVMQAENNLIEAIETEFIIKHNIRNFAQDSVSSEYVFQHDRIQQAAYQLIPESERNALHYKIGCVLFAETTPDRREEMIMTIVNQLNYGLSLANTVEEKQEIIKANLIAAKRAQKGTIYSAANNFYTNALRLLPKTAWIENYDLCFELHENLAICELLNGNASRAEDLFNLLIEKAKTNQDKARIYLSKIALFYGATPSFAEIFKITKKALKLYEIDFYEHPSRIQSFQDRMKLSYFANKSIVDRIKQLPFCYDSDLNMISEIYAKNFYYALYEGNQPLMRSIIVKAFAMILKHGLNESSAYVLSCFTTLLLGQNKDYKIVYQFAELTLEISKRFPFSKSFDAVYPVYSQTYRCGEYIGKGVEQLLALGRRQHETGNFRTSALSQSTAARLCFMKGDSIDSVLEKVDHLLENVELNKTYSEYTYLQIVKLSCLALKGLHQMDCRPPEFNEANLSRIPKGARQHLEIKYGWHQLILDFHEENYYKVIETRHLFEKITPYWPYRDEFYYYYCLALAASHKQNLKTVKSIQKMFKKWAAASPANYLHRYLLISAEIARLTHEKDKAIHLYELAIEKAKKNQFQQDTALIYELLGKFHIEEGNPETAAFFLNMSKEWYALWGATSKVKQLEEKYQNTLASSLKPESASIEMFDIKTIINASLALSKEINLEKLVQALMKILVVNAGATKAFIIIQKNEQLEILSELLPGQEKPEILTGVELQDRKGELSSGIINYVARSHREVVLHNAPHEGIFQEDPYISEFNPFSILSLPLFNQGKFFGVLYLENQKTKGVFTSERVHLLKLLSSQIAISVENAHFYSTLEQKVEERTKELSERNLELKNTMHKMNEMQSQLIQKEKLASMGLLASGLAHELQNPLNFIINFSDIASHSLGEIKSLENQQKLLDQIKQYLEKIGAHGKRAEKIIKGMLAFDRLGSRHKEKINLNVLLDRALKTMEKEYGYQVQIIKKYDENLVPLDVYQEDMFTVFKNLIENAFDALKNIEHERLIEVETKNLPGEIWISIKDNGEGISNEIKDKILQPFFTTKQTGSRVGLGLSIAFDILTKEHKGELSFQSEKGKYAVFIIKIPV